MSDPASVCAVTVESGTEEFVVHQLKSLRRRRTGQARVVGMLAEALEGRRLLTFGVTTAIPDTTVPTATTSTNLPLSGYFSDPAQTDTKVLMHFEPYTTGAVQGGDVVVQLTDSVTPATVANFLSYVNSGAYNNTFIHRSVPGFIIQGGGYQAVTGVPHITQGPMVVNEYAQALAAAGGAGSKVNVRGTIAMAKLGGNPNSATSEWFFNLADNSSNLDNQNGGFTTFGTVVQGMVGVVDGVAGLPIVNAGSPFDTLPVAGDGTVSGSNLSNLVRLTYATADATYQAQAVSSNNNLFSSIGIVGSRLVLNYQAGEYGDADVTITATDFDGNTATDTFTVHHPRITATYNSSAVTSGQGAALNFGTATMSTFTGTVSVKNSGTAGSLTLSSVNVPAGYSLVGSLPGALAPGASANLTFAVDTSTLGVKAGTITVNSDDPSIPAFAFDVTTTVSHAVISASESGNPITDNVTVIAYGATDQQQPVSKWIKITNTGDQTLTFPSAPTEPAGFLIGAVSTDGTDNGFITGTVTFPGGVRTVSLPPLAPGASFYIKVSTRTDTGGDKSGTLTIHSNDPTTPDFDVQLTGLVHYRKLEVAYNGGTLVFDRPTWQVTPALALGAVVEGTSPHVTLHVTNTGDTMDLTLQTPTLPAGYSIVTPLPATLAAGASADLVLAVDTSRVGTHGEFVVINSGDPLYQIPPNGMPAGLRIPLNYTVDYRRLVVTRAGGGTESSGTGLDFGTIVQGDVAEQTYRLSNTGTLPLTLSNLSVPTGFTMTNFPSSIAAGSFVDVVVAMNTASARGTYSGALSFDTDDTSGATPFVLNVAARLLGKGIVVSAQDGSVIPYGQAQTVDFGTVRRGASGVQVTFAVKNAGVLPLDIQATSIPAGFTLVSGLPASLAPGASAQMTVALDTSAAGIFGGEMHIVSSDPDRPSFDVPLAATVSLPVVLGKGGVKAVTYVDADGTTATLTLTGAGSATLDFVGAAPTSKTVKGATGVGPKGVTLSSVTLAGTTAKSALVVTTKGGNRTIDLAGVSGSTVGAISAPGARLTGTMAINARTVALNSASGGTLTLLGAGANVSFTGAVSNTSVTAAGAIKSVKAQSWSGGSITAAALDSLTIDKNFSGALAVTKAIKSVAIKGMASGVWNVGTLTSVSAGRTFAATVTATNLGTLAVKGAISGASVRVAKKITSVTATSVTNSKLYAGVDAGSNPPATAAVWSGAGSIGSLTVKNFIGSSVAAKVVKSAALGNVKTQNGGVALGVASSNVGEMTFAMNGGRKVTVKGVKSGAALAAQLKAQKVTLLNDFKVLMA